MPVYRLGDREAAFLATGVHESAMGYQVIQTDYLSFAGRTLLILNSRLAIPFLDYEGLVRDLNRIGDQPWESLLERAQWLQFEAEPQNVADSLNVRLVASLLDHSIEWNEEAEDSLVRQEIVARETLTEPRLFFRFSATPVDPRVRPDGSWAPGTYATTYNDLRIVPSGFAAVGRYALPNPHSARFLFPILTQSSPIYIGTVAPNFGQAGGGVEVLFPSGAAPVHGRPHRIERE